MEKRRGDKTMKLTVLGATGNVGKELVEQALAAGHEVTVLVRAPEKLGEIRSRVTVVQGNVTDSEAISRAVAGRDAVLSTLGHRKNSPDDVLAVAMKHTIVAMQLLNVQRLVVVGNSGLIENGDQPTGFQKFMSGLMNVIASKNKEDHNAQARLIEKSGLDWVIVRPPVLAGGVYSGKYHTGEKLDKNIGAKIIRADLADFMLKCVTNDASLHTMPAISN
jgi:putative NADH-flavin reductase